MQRKSGVFRKQCRVAGICLILLTVTACETVDFYTQAVVGHMSLMASRKPVAEVATDPDTPAEVQRKLALAARVLKFAEVELGLSAGGAYTTYVDTGKPYVVWNVFAAPRFSTTLTKFCFPIAGCVGYRGYFDEGDAKEFAASLEKRDFDVYVGGVAAYSTLGWFDDPILNTFLSRTDTDFAALLFHEIAHHAVYLSGDTKFNESFATTVERAALKRWLASEGDNTAFAEYIDRRRLQDEVIYLITQTRKELAKEYESLTTDNERAEIKRKKIAQLRSAYQTLIADWPNGGGFDGWMKADINNAKLGAVSTYNDWVPAFDAMLASASGDIADFVGSVKRLAEENRQSRDEKLSLIKPE